MLKIDKDELDTLYDMLKNTFTFKGKDGNEYNSLEEVIEADKRYDTLKDIQKPL